MFRARYNVLFKNLQLLYKATSCNGNLFHIINYIYNILNKIAEYICYDIGKNIIYILIPVD